MSIMDYNENRSTSLMARDLLTPDEIKQLHYKTIIFPIIGYPIFRDTIIYSKFSCYQSGEVERNAKSLRKLDNTYFIVEQIRTSLGEKFRTVEDNDMDKEARDFYKEQREDEEKNLFKAIEQIQNIVKQEELNYEYKNKNNRTYSVVTLDKPLTTVEETLIKGQIDTNIYYIEIDNNQDGKSIIEVHLKNVLDYSLQMSDENIE